LRKPWSAYLGITASPQDSFLAETSLTGTINYWMARSVVYGSVLSLKFPDSSATVLAPGFTWYFTDRWSVDSRVYWVEQTHGYAVLVAPEWKDSRGNRLGLTLVAGEAAENLGISGGILRTPSRSARFEFTWRLADRLGLNGSLFHEHRAGLYDRRGFSAGLVAWW
jgi:YaiO family outer membrane protein